MELPVFEEIIYEKKEGISKITINRPRAYNAFTSKTLEELTLAFEDADRDPAVGVVVLTGAGEKAFCSGGDLKESAQPGGYNRENDYWHARLHHTIRSISKPTIAAVNGYAIGGGHKIWAGGSQSRQLRCGVWRLLSCPVRRREEGQGDLVSLPTVYSTRGP